MNDKKHIDRLFQEKFKDFEMKPNENVWANIESQLEKPKRKRRIIPIWLQYGGVAAALLLFLAIGNSFLNNNDIERNTVVDTKTEENVRSNTSKDENKNTINKEKEKIKDVIEDNENNTAISNTNDTDSKSTESNELSDRDASKALKNKAKSRSNLISSPNNKITSVVVNSNNQDDSKYIAVKDKRNNATANNINNYSEESVANNLKNNSVPKKQTNASLYAQNTTKSNNENNSIPNTNIARNNDINKDKTNIKIPQVIDNNAISSTDVATTNSEKEEKENMIEKDSANSSETIEEAIAKIEDLNEKEEEKEVDKWTVNANVAPVYYNTLGKGSHIHDQFIDNPKDGEINTSYGIKVGYALSKKLKVRSGVNKLNLSYDTANVIVYNDVSNTPNASALRNINFIPNAQGQKFTVLSKDNLSVFQVSNLVGNNLNVALSQRISYVEVPLELEYALIDKKLGVNVIGGASAFFLGDNEVVSEIDNQKQKIGEANNINDVSYSANIGLGIDYKFSKKLKFNLEPTFKYQMNAYNETSGDFRPYIIGVYTGFSYKF